jgi:hypothetical protein
VCLHIYTEQCERPAFLYVIKSIITWDTGVRLRPARYLVAIEAWDWSLSFGTNNTRHQPEAFRSAGR